MHRMENLGHLSDDELVAQLQECTFDIRRQTVRTLVFLIEIKKRSLHLLAAASSMFDYCRRFLKMSHGRAYRFSQGAKLCKQYPHLLEGIESGELYLSTLVHVAPFIEPENVKELVAETRGKESRGRRQSLAAPLRWRASRRPYGELTAERRRPQEHAAASA